MIDKSMISIILGGGQGTRLFPLTEVRSKPAVPVGGKYRLIDIPISNCLNSGVKRIYVLTQYNSASLNRHIKNTYHFDMFSSGFVDILAAEQTTISKDWFQGTSDAVKQCMIHLENNEYEYVLILAGDQLYQMDFEKLLRYHIAQNADITIATTPVDASDAGSFGIMKVNESSRIDRFIEKPKSDVLAEWKSPVEPYLKEQGREYLASMGIYIFNKAILKQVFEDYATAVDFGKEIIPNAIRDGLNVAGYAFDGYWTDIGTVKSFYKENLALTEQVPKFNLYDNLNTIYTRPRLLAPSKVFGSEIDQSMIAEGSIIHASLVRKSIIGIRSRIGQRTTIEHSIVMGAHHYETLEEMKSVENTVKIGIGADCVIRRAIVDTNARVGSNVSIVGDSSLKDMEHEDYRIVDGIVVVKKGALIPDNTKIGLVD